jgi:hypothetical protein
MIGEVEIAGSGSFELVGVAGVGEGMRGFRTVAEGSRERLRLLVVRRIR